MTIRREESDSRSRRVVSLCDPDGLGCQRDWGDYQAVDKRQVEEAREPGTLVAVRRWCREANETDKTLSGSVCVVVWIWTGLGFGFDSIRFGFVCLYCRLVQVLGWACGGGITKTNSRSRL